MNNDTPVKDPGEALQTQDKNKDVTLNEETKENFPQGLTRTNSESEPEAQSKTQALGVEKPGEPAEPKSLHKQKAESVVEEKKTAVEEAESEARRLHELDAAKQKSLEAEELERQLLAQEKSEEKERNDVAAIIGMTAAPNMASFSAALFGTSPSDQNRNNTRGRSLTLEMGRVGRAGPSRQRDELSPDQDLTSPRPQRPRNTIHDHIGPKV